MKKSLTNSDKVMSLRCFLIDFHFNKYVRIKMYGCFYKMLTRQKEQPLADVLQNSSFLKIGKVRRKH